jgi:hypothetical protein
MTTAPLARPAFAREQGLAVKYLAYSDLDADREAIA